MRAHFLYGTLVALGVGVIAAACGGSDNSNGGEINGGDAGDDATMGDANDDGFVVDGTSGDGATGDGATGFDGAPPVDATFPCDGCTPFPGPGTTACAPSVLAPPALVYPPDGVLLPPNMNVLEVQWKPATGATLYDVSFTNGVTNVHVTSPCNAVPDVRGGASKGCGLTLPLAAWQAMANENRDGDPVKVTVRATKDGSCVSSSMESVNISFARDDLAGGIYYWQSATFGGVAGTTGGIYSHDFGTFDPTPTPFYTSGGTGTCVGCHTLSRDGERMALMTDDPDADDEYGDVKMHVMDVAKRSVLGGQNVSPGFQTFTHDHSKFIATTFKTKKDLNFDVWNGDGTTLLSTFVIPGMKGTHPDLSRDDKQLVFVSPGPIGTGTMAMPSIDASGDHHFLSGSLYTMTFDPTSNAFGTPTSLLASTGTQTYYYPSFSPDSAWIVLNEAPKGDAFYNRQGRVKLLRLGAAGAKPLDMPALNKGDGLSNSWPRWSPFVQTYKGKKLLWLTFSSNRDYGLHLGNQGLTYVDPVDGTTKPIDNCYPPEGPTNALYENSPQPLSKKGVTMEHCQQPQIWMAAVVVDPDASLDAKDRSFPAFWLPFQDVNSHNHSAQWVEKVVAPPPPMTSDAGTDGGGMACVPAGGGCSSALCCSDVVCCGGTCQADCVR